LVSVGILATGITWYLASHKPKKTRSVNAKIIEINVYPIKSCKGLSVEAWNVDKYGLQYDRNWMIVDSQSSRFISQRQIPKLALVQPSFQDNFTYLCLEAPSMEPVKIPISNPSSYQKRTVSVWDDECPDCIDEGDVVSEWLTRYAKMHKAIDDDGQLRLVRIPEYHNRKTEQNYQVQKTENLVSFADGFPFLLISVSSLNELNQRIRNIQGSEVIMKQFRPNIVVDGEKMFPFIEDKWKEISVGNILFHVLKSCTRCKLTTVNPEIGVFAGPEPLQTLHTFREGLLDGGKEVCFGQNLTHVGTGVLHANDLVTVQKWK